MTPVRFPLTNKTLTPRPRQSTPDYVNGIEGLPVYTDGQQVVSCWRASWRERVSVLLFGRVWLQVLSGSTQPPVAVNAVRELLEVKP